MDKVVSILPVKPNKVSADTISKQESTLQIYGKKNDIMEIILD